MPEQGERAEPAHNPRRYDLALAVAGLAPTSGPDASDTADGNASPSPRDLTAVTRDRPLPADATPATPSEPPPADATAPSRPPPGAPTVRPPARRAVRPTPAFDGLLESAADSLLLVTEPDGSTAFDISIRDDVFDELACRIRLREGHLSATFRVHDVNLRRLLEAELGRLRAALADRGLAVDDVSVAQDDD